MLHNGCIECMYQSTWLVFVASAVLLFFLFNKFDSNAALNKYWVRLSAFKRLRMYGPVWIVILEKLSFKLCTLSIVVVSFTFLCVRHSQFCVRSMFISFSSFLEGRIGFSIERSVLIQLKNWNDHCYNFSVLLRGSLLHSNNAFEVRFHTHQ